MKIKVNNSNILNHAGMGLIYCGSILLIASYVLGAIQSNALLIISALMILTGTIIHIYRLKKESKY